ncbi:MAG: bacteriohemerythrin [Magnetococcus sp. YQC-5]
MPEKFLLGNPAVDMQHEVLFALYHEVTLSLQEGTDSYNLGDIFLGLNMYVVNHFQFEEDAMQVSGYPDSSNHCNEHIQLKKNVGLLYQRFLDVQGKPEEKQVAQEIATFLYQWLEHHIAKVDRYLCQYLQEQKIDA